jgi:hypothetical protein
MKSFGTKKPIKVSGNYQVFCHSNILFHFTFSPTAGLIPWEISPELYVGAASGYCSDSRQDIITVRGLFTLTMK